LTQSAAAVPEKRQTRTTVAKMRQIERMKRAPGAWRPIYQ
jgi:hypothetical protein